MRLLITACVFAILAAPALAQEEQSAPPPPPGCEDPAFRQLDFWIGDWSLSWDKADGSKGRGTNSISREYDGCVIYEEFSSPEMEFEGMSVSTYDRTIESWRQTWVDDQGGYYDLVGGPAEGEDHAFALELARLSDDTPYLRMIWQDVTEDSLTWRWQGKTGPGAEWTDRWVIEYARITP